MDETSQRTIHTHNLIPDETEGILQQVGCGENIPVRNIQSIGTFPVHNIQPVGIFQYKIASQKQHSSTHYSLGGNIPVQNSQSLGTFQFKMFSQ